MKDVTTMAADNIRILAASMVEKSKSGHPGGAMGGADFINVLYTEFLKYDPDDPTYPFRDRFFLDPGHMSPMLYSVLALAGYFSLEDLKNFRQWGSPTPGHPELDLKRGIENTSGPLGQGHAMALGAAIAERFMVARLVSGWPTKPLHLSPMEVFRRRCRRVLAVSPVTWDCTTSSCSTIQTTSSFQPRWKRFQPKTS